MTKSDVYYIKVLEENVLTVLFDDEITKEEALERFQKEEYEDIADEKVVKLREVLEVTPLIQKDPPKDGNVR